MIKTNRDKLVMQSVQGKIHHGVGSFPYRIDQNGVANILPATGGICYNVKVGDPAFGWIGDHIEPGVTVRNENRGENLILNMLTCIGNEAKVVSGDAKGAKGVVTGIHGGVEHILIDFDKDDMENMALDDKILIKGYGQGLKIDNIDDIILMNIDPNLFEKIGFELDKDNNLIAPVVNSIPPYLMGSGIGTPTAFKGDYDLMTTDRETISNLKLDQLKFGDIVLIEDWDNSYGRAYMKGAVSVGVVVHSDCIKMGHGPGITIIATSREGKIIPKIDQNSNISNFF